MNRYYIKSSDDSTLYITDEETYLAHHGVKGQKWGIIRDRVKTGIRTGVNNIEKNVKKFNNERRFKKGISSAQNPTKYSEDELNKMIARKQLDKKYLDSFKGQPGDVNAHTRTSGRSIKDSYIEKRVNPKVYTDKELRDIIERKKLENSYNLYFPEQPSKAKVVTKKIGSAVVKTTTVVDRHKSTIFKALEWDEKQQKNFNDFMAEAKLFSDDIKTVIK